MILDELVLHNFGPYEGKQTIRLTPKDSARPIVLIGGLNGSGKTTLLDGLHLALYGQRAQCSKRGQDGYYSFLRRAVHTGKRKCSDAAVELQFRHRAEGIDHTYRICRTWRLTPSSATENVEVYVDGQFDQGATDRWAELAEEFLPVGVANLFLFDGEKIQELAEVERSSEIIRTAVHGLLGLDVINQLENDLKVLERRKRGESKLDNQDVEKVVETEKELQELEKQAEKLLADRASAHNELTLAQKQLAKLEASFERQGGKLYENEQTLKQVRKELATELDHIEHSLRDGAQSMLPLLLLEPQLARLRDEDLVAERARLSKVLSETLKERDSQVLKFLAKLGDDSVVARLKKFLSDDRKARAAYADSEYASVSGLGSHARALLGRLCDGDLHSFGRRIARELEDAERIREEINNVDRQIEAVPDEASLHELIDSRKTAQKHAHQAEGKLHHLDEEREKVLREVQSVQAKIVRQKKEWSKSKHAAEGTGRVILYSEKVRDTLAQFASVIVKKHIARIESLVTESYRLLLRKDGLVAHVLIDPQTYQVRLLDASGQSVEPERLSAGERQLFAIAMLWGLARSSGRPLPAVIDTPLGRLDSDHRRNVVNHYFPQASHQVLLLSTDEEIGKEHYHSLERSLAHTYTLEHDDTQNATHIREGYAFAWE